MSTQEKTDKQLLSLRQSIEKGTQSAEQLSNRLSAEWESIREKVEQYAIKRVESFKQALETKGMTWCTYCNKVVPEADGEFLYFEGREKYSGGYQNSCYGFRGFSGLHRACSSCRESATDRHGWKGSRDSFLKDQAYFHAFRVEKREDGFYARRFGQWVKLDDGQCELKELPPDRLVEESAEEWNLPPRIDYSFMEKKLVIHETAARDNAA